MFTCQPSPIVIYLILYLILHLGIIGDSSMLSHNSFKPWLSFIGNYLSYLQLPSLSPPVCKMRVWWVHRYYLDCGETATRNKILRWVQTYPRWVYLDGYACIKPHIPMSLNEIRGGLVGNIKACEPLRSYTLAWHTWFPIVEAIRINTRKWAWHFYSWWKLPPT